MKAMEKHRVRTDVIIAADTYISRKLNGKHASVCLIGLYHEVDSYLRSMDVYFTHIELAFGWLVEKGRIKLDVYGTNAWAKHCGLEALPFNGPIVRIGFADIPTFGRILTAYRNSQATRQNLAKAKRQDRQAEQELRDAYGSAQPTPQASELVSASALG